MPGQPMPPKGPKGGKKKNQQMLLIGGGGAAVVVVFALMKRSSAGSAATGTTAATTGVQGTYDSTANDVYNSLEGQLGILQQQLAGITATNAGTGAGTPASSTPPSGTSSPVASGPPPVANIPSNPGKRIIFGPNPPRRSLFQTVTVSHGQTLGGIAAAHHESLSTLLRDNPTYTRNAKYRGGNRIWAGDKVKVR